MKTIDCAGSSNITSIEYDPDTQDLTVVFSSGTYVYHNVPMESVDALEAAPSKGSHVARHIRTAHQFTKV